MRTSRIPELHHFAVGRSCDREHRTELEVGTCIRETAPFWEDMRAVAKWYPLERCLRSRSPAQVQKRMTEIHDMPMSKVQTRRARLATVMDCVVPSCHRRAPCAGLCLSEPRLFTLKKNYPLRCTTTCCGAKGCRRRGGQCTNTAHHQVSCCRRLCVVFRADHVRDVQR